MRVPEWLTSNAPSWAQGWLECLFRPWVLTTMAVVTLLMIATSVIGIPWFIARAPVDYFTQHARAQREQQHSRPASIAFRIAKNLVGAVLVVAGIAMLVLPGQGLLTILAAVLLLDFPGKNKLERRILSSPRVFALVNRLRRHAGREPFDPSSLRTTGGKACS